jgi:hypothetical protein
MTERSEVRRRFYVESVLACVSAYYLLVTLFWRDWIRVVFNWHSGGLAWGIAAAQLAVTLALVLLARAERARAEMR